MVEKSRPMFDKKYIESEFRKIGKELPEKIQIILLGGANMIYRGLKASTKDIDIVFSDYKELELFFNALKELNYYEFKPKPLEYEMLGTSAILRNTDGFQCDIFYKQVCNGLIINDQIIKRANKLADFDNLTVSLMSMEDVFLFKSITERREDLDDMKNLIEHGLDWETILNECQAQSGYKIWEAFLLEKLSELHKIYGIHSPIIRKLTQISEYKLIKDQIISFIEDEKSFNEISDHLKSKYDLSKTWIKKQLDKMVIDGVINKEKKGRTYYYSCYNK
jgi:hypothetical protein